MPEAEVAPDMAAIVADLEAKLVKATPQQNQSCEHCGGYGATFGHAPDCDYDLCALAGGIDDCDGQLEPCECRLRLEESAINALPALLAERTALLARVEALEEMLHGRVAQDHAEVRRRGTEFDERINAGIRPRGGRFEL